MDETGKLLDHGVVYPTKPRHDVAGTKRELARLVKKDSVNTIVIGNGTASRETEEVVSEFIAEQAPSLRYTIVNEAGASVYSASELASQEYPDLDVTVRGAMSLGRRLQDPLAELVKIPPQSIGVGQYQHDLDQAELSRTLGHVVEDVVNRVGVDVNTASASLLGYVSGITPSVAKNIVAYREENGAFTDRRQLKKVPKLGPKAYLNAAGFLRISGGKNPLDATSVHPESYEVATAVLERAGVAASELSRGGVPDIERRLGSISALASDLDCGTLTLIDIVNELKKPGRDPRDDAPEVVFSRSALSIDDLEPGMELKGTVRNVVDFGAFVDVGVHQDGLVHISKLANRFVKHPSDVVRVGDTVKVWLKRSIATARRSPSPWCRGSKPPSKVPPLATCKIASILQIPPFRMPLRDEKARNSPRFSVIRAKTGAVPCFTQLVKAFTLLNTLNFARRRRGYLCPRQDMEAYHQPTGKFVSAAPAFPLPSATLAKRVSDRERKGRGEQPAM